MVSLGMLLSIAAAIMSLLLSALAVILYNWSKATDARLLETEKMANAINVRLTAQETKSNANERRLDELKEDLSEVKSDISEVKTDVSEVLVKLTEISTLMQHAQQVGGRK